MRYIYFFLFLFMIQACSQRGSIEIKKVSHKQSLKDIEVAKLTHKIHKKRLGKDKKLSKKRVTKKIKKSNKKYKKADIKKTIKKSITPIAIKLLQNKNINKNKATRTIRKKPNTNTTVKKLASKNKVTPVTIPVDTIIIDKQLIVTAVKSQFTPINIVITIVQSFLKQDFVISLLFSACMHLRDFFPKSECNKKPHKAKTI